MLEVAGLLLRTVYLVLPLAVLLMRLRDARRTQRWRPIVDLMILAGWATLISVGLSFAYAFYSAAYLSVSQVLIGAYFGTGMLLILRGFNDLLMRATRLVRPRSALVGFLLAMPVAIGRIGILFAVGLPWVMSTLMIYRPKVMPGNDPAMRWNVDYQRVAFDATDGTRIVGWWIPSLQLNDRGRRTVLVAHGLGSSKSNHLILAEELVAAGYNVLAIDHRAHGESGGQLCTFGDRERYDVLGAVRWLTATHADRTDRIYGVGASMGAAALIAAAADPSPEGQHIDVVAVYGTFDELRNEIHTAMTDHFPKPLGWLLEHVGVPIASLHVGRNLKAFSPVAAVEQLWPRPLMVIHGTQDEIIRFEHGHRLYQRALQPKQHLWIQRGTHNGIIDDTDTRKAVLEFFDNARSVL